MATGASPDIFIRLRSNAAAPPGQLATSGTASSLGVNSVASVLGELPWDANNPGSALQQLEQFIIRLGNGTPALGIKSAEVQTDYAWSPQGGAVTLPPGTPRWESGGFGQAATGWVITGTAGSLTVTIAGTVVTTAFVTSAAVTAINQAANINQNTTVNQYCTAFVSVSDPTRVILVANTSPWDHVIGNQITLTAAGTGQSASGATFGATNTAPAAIGVNAPSYAVNV